jgi:hypothetical protein
MFTLPTQNHLFETATYTDIFALTAVWNVALFGMLVFILFFVFLIMKIHYLRKSRSAIERNSMLT